MLRLGLLIGFSLFGMVACYARKEYPNESTYYKDFPQGKHNGTDGHWLKKDRLQHTGIWSVANETNLIKPSGFEEYDTIEERSDFYKWFQLKTDSLGFDTKWTKIAAITTRKLSKLLSALPSLTGNSNKEIKTFVIKGNQLIFDDIWKELHKIKTRSGFKSHCRQRLGCAIVMEGTESDQSFLFKTLPQISTHFIEIVKKRKPPF